MKNSSLPPSLRVSSAARGPWLRGTCSWIALALTCGLSNACDLVSSGTSTNQCTTLADCDLINTGVEGLTCQNNLCVLPETWSCLDDPIAPKAEGPTLEVGFPYTVSFTTALGQPVPGVVFKACRFQDPSCSAPIAELAVSGDDGRVDPAPSMVVARGEEGSADYIDGRELWYAAVPPPEAGLLTLAVFSPALSTTIAAGTTGATPSHVDFPMFNADTLSLFGATADPALGQAVLVAVSCAVTATAGVRFEFPELAQRPVVGYQDGFQPAPPGTTATQDIGSAIAFNLPVGTHIASHVRDEDDVEVVREHFFSHPGTVSWLFAPIHRRRAAFAYTTQLEPAF